MLLLLEKTIVLVWVWHLRKDFLGHFNILSLFLFFYNWHFFDFPCVIFNRFIVTAALITCWSTPPWSWPSSCSLALLALFIIALFVRSITFNSTLVSIPFWQELRSAFFWCIVFFCSRRMIYFLGSRNLMVIFFLCFYIVSFFCRRSWWT